MIFGNGDKFVFYQTEETKWRFRGNAVDTLCTEPAWMVPSDALTGMFGWLVGW